MRYVRFIKLEAYKRDVAPEGLSCSVSSISTPWGYVGDLGFWDEVSKQDVVAVADDIFRAVGTDLLNDQISLGKTTIVSMKEWGTAVRLRNGSWVGVIVTQVHAKLQAHDIDPEGFIVDANAVCMPSITATTVIVSELDPDEMKRLLEKGLITKELGGHVKFSDWLRAKIKEHVGTAPEI